MIYMYGNSESFTYVKTLLDIGVCEYLDYDLITRRIHLGLWLFHVTDEIDESLNTIQWFSLNFQRIKNQN